MLLVPTFSYNSVVVTKICPTSLMRRESLLSSGNGHPSNPRGPGCPVNPREPGEPWSPLGPGRPLAPFGPVLPTKYSV